MKPMMKFQTRFIPFIAMSVLALLFALWAGLLRLGWALPTFPMLASAHGPLMIAGFLGVLIPLERAVAIRQKWMFAVPTVTGLGWMTLFFFPFGGAALITLGSLGTFAILGVMVRREPQVHTLTMMLGALSWVVGNFLWLFGFPIFKIIFLWIAFLILTIGGERLELSRVLQPTASQRRIFIGITIALLAGAVLSLFALDWGARLSGLSMLLLALWFLKNDLARRNIRHKNPLTRYIAICLFSGFIWLGIGGILNLIIGASYAGPLYDAALHTIFVGFVISMIFGHAPIIFPAILGAPITYTSAFYAHLFLLHASLVLRIFGDLSGSMDIRRLGGLLNEIAILLFLGLTIYSIVKGKK
jgi:hypothetical protein